MKFRGNILQIVLAMMLAFVNTQVFAADTSIATLNLSGNVPAVFSVTARGYPGDLDLTPSASVSNRVLGILHFKYNVNVATITIASSTANGVPATAGGVDYPFGATGFTVATPSCTSLNATFAAGVTLSNAGTDYGSATAKDLTASNPDSGIEEDCQITASWSGTTASLPLAGVYSMTITVTMVSI